MALLIKPGRDAAENWVEALGAALPDLDVRVWPEVENRAEIEYIIMSRIDEGEIATFPNLRFIATTNVGVDRLLADPALPPDVPVVRSVNAERTALMTGFILYNVIRHHRRHALHEANQRAHNWEMLKYPPPGEVGVGMMGLGVLSGAAARALAGLMYDVAAWTRTPKDEPGIANFVGPEQLAPFLARSDILVSILPQTTATNGLLNADTLALLPEGAYVINAGRGSLLDEEALLAAIDSGHLSGAALDVYAQEPLPADHPFWEHPRITMTPHDSCAGRARFSAEIVVENIRRDREGRPLIHTVDREAGY